MVLQGGPCGRVGHRRTILEKEPQLRVETRESGLFRIPSYSFPVCAFLVCVFPVCRRVVRREVKALHRQFVVRPARLGLFEGAEQGHGRQAAVRSGGQKFRELGEGSHGRHVLQDEGEWWVEATGG